MAQSLDIVAAEDVESLLDESGMDEDCFFLYQGGEMSMWDAIDNINEQLASFGIALATGCDDDYGFARLVKLK